MPRSTPAVRDLLAACLRDLGATRTFGASAPDLSGLTHVPVAEPSVAALLADADGRIGPGPGVAVLPEHRLRITAAPGATTGELAEPVIVTDASDLPLAIARWSVEGANGVNAVIELQLDLDLDAPAPVNASVLRLDPTGGRSMVLDEALRDVQPIILAGPGVVRAGKVDALREVAAKAACGVVNTWGAKGLLPWDSPHHYGTAGLQALDFDLAGVRDAPLVLAVGLDGDESPPDRWAGGQVLDLEPAHLDLLTASWTDPARPVPPYPKLYTELSTVLAPLYASDSVPLSPARAAADLAAARPDGTLVVADPGPAGLWVARAFPTTEAGSVIVPSRRCRGFAAAAGLVAALDGRAAIGVTHEPADQMTDAIFELAVAWDAALVLEVWGSEADSRVTEPSDRIANLRGALAAPTQTRLGVPVDFALTKTIVDVAGEVVAWM
ncbi:MAG: hypothetical protein HYX32_04360 [Actinobacteria bacterium]|nr:hypothetical protein [Actinomycetota bacterium]